MPTKERLNIENNAIKHKNADLRLSNSYVDIQLSPVLGSKKIGEFLQLLFYLNDFSECYFWCVSRFSVVDVRKIAAKFMSCTQVNFHVIFVKIIIVTALYIFTVP